MIVVSRTYFFKKAGVLLLRLFLFALILLCTKKSFSQGQIYNFYKLDNYNGLSHNQVTAILKDRDGFLWFGTMSGLNRYDGYYCKVMRKNFNDSLSLVDNSIQSLYELPDSHMWVGTMAGPCIYSSRTEKFNADYAGYLQSLGLPGNGVSSVVKGNDNRYWFLYENQDVYLYSSSEKKATHFNLAPGINAKSKITGVCETGNGKVWLVYQDGLLQQYDLNAKKIIYSSASLQHLNKENNTYHIFIDHDGDAWLWALNIGVYLFQPAHNILREFSETSFPYKLNNNLVTQIVQDNNGLIWLSTDHGGINLVDKKQNFKVSYLLNDPKDPRSISQNSINSMYKDSTGIIWLGTYKQGVNYLNSNIVLFPLFRHQESNANSLPYDDVNRFVEDKAGNLWIGTNGGGLIFYNRKENKFKQYLHDPNNPNSLSNNVIVSLCFDHNDVLWIGTYFGGLNSFDGKQFTHFRHSDTDTSSISNDNIWEIFEDSKNNLWIGTLGGGLDLFNRESKSFKHYPYRATPQDIVSSNFISSILEDKSGNLWVGSSGGISVIEYKGEAKPLQQFNSLQNKLSNNNVICLLQDSRGRIWAGAREGLNVLDEKTKQFHRFTVADGLPDNMILNIIEDNHKTLWVATANGLCNLVLNENTDVPSFSVISYDETNNLQNREFNDNAALKTRAGELIFGGPSGFNIINPDKIAKSSYQPKIIFTGLQVLNNSVETGEVINGRVLLLQSLSQVKGIQLKYKENVFSIELTSLDFAHSAGNKYAYMLQGFNADWLYADGTQRRVTYTNLSPGSYTLKVKILNRDGVWSDVKQLQIDIEPPFWRTPLAYIIYAIVITALLLLARRITLDRIHMRYELRHQRRETERAHALDQLKTKFLTNVSHEFRTPLSLIIAPLDKIIKHTSDEEQQKQLNLVQRNAKRLLSLVNQLLDFRRMEVQEMKLHPAIGDIIGFSKDISLSFMDIAEKKNIRFSFSSDIEHLEIYFDKDKIEKILFNLLSNAFKYTHDNGEVSILLSYQAPGAREDDGLLSIEVKDTGIGIPTGMQEKVFERFFQTDVPESMVNQGTGIGLAITKEFVKLHKGTISVKSEPEKGTSFTVLLPAKKIFESPTRVTAIPAEELEEETMPEESHKSSKKKTILVVEDNEDIRFYLKDNLKGQYKVEEASNGRDGWEKTRALYPDLVISDIMMPLMDGVELARKIKTETITAHIPIILLSAIGNEEKQLEGFNAGVNDYITKPFTFEILASRIKSLLAQQDVLQKRFQKQIEVNPKEITVTPVDEKFLEQALEIVEKNMDNPDFSVEDFSRDMFMNRVTLYRKILSITGKTPLEFIRAIRLKRAAQLLQKSGMSISEIAYEVGFNNPKNFTKAFKEEFNMLPSQYMAINKKKDD